MPTLFDLLPGYLPMPHAGQDDLQSCVRAGEQPAGFWGPFRSYAVSLLKAWFGDAATADNDWCYGYLPRLTGDHGTYQTVGEQIDGVCKGYFLVGENPAVGSANGRKQRPGLARVSRVTAGAGVLGRLAALIHDLGRPDRFLNMLRVFKTTSPLSMGSWTIAAYSPLASAAAASDVTGVLTLAGRAAGIGAAAPVMATYPAVLIGDTAVPARHGVHAELPFAFGGSAMASAAGVAPTAAPLAETSPAARTALAGATTEVAATEIVMRRLGLAAEPYSQGKAGKLMRAARALTAAGAAGAVLGRRSRIASAAAGVALVAGSGALRFAVFEAGLRSARDPKYTVIPQRERVEERAS